MPRQDKGKGMAVSGIKRGNRAIKHARKPINSKKAITVWISWVLLVTFVIFLGTMVFYWMRDFSTGRMTELENRLSASEKCEFVSLELSDVVSKNAQTLNMKVTNRYNLGINQIVFSLYDAQNNFILLNISDMTINVTIKPNSTKTIEIPQNSSIATARIQAVPVIIDDEKQIYCTERIAEANVTS